MIIKLTENEKKFLSEHQYVKDWYVDSTVLDKCSPEYDEFIQIHLKWGFVQKDAESISFIALSFKDAVQQLARLRQMTYMEAQYYKGEA